MSLPQILLIFHLQDILGNINQGSVLFTLIYPPSIMNPGGVARVPGTALVVQYVTEVQADVTGLVSVNIWGNDLLTPGPNGSYYVLTFKDDGGSTICSIPYQFTGAGTQDLSNLAPFTGAPSITPAPPNAVVTNPVGQQTIAGFPLSANFIGQFIGSLGKNVPANSATPQFDLSKGSVHRYVMTSNISPTFVNLQDGQIIVLILVQDAVGNRVVTFPANVLNAQSPDPTANLRTLQLLAVDGTNLIAVPSVI